MLPEAFTKRMKTLLAEGYGAFLDSFSRPRAVALRLNPLKPGIESKFTVPWFLHAVPGIFTDTSIRYHLINPPNLSKRLIIAGLFCLYAGFLLPGKRTFQREHHTPIVLLAS